METPNIDSRAPADDTDELTTCDECGAEVSVVVGAPDGAEICHECFNQGAH